MQELEKSSQHNHIFTHFFEARHPRCVSNKSNDKVYAYIVKHN